MTARIRSKSIGQRIRVKKSKLTRKIAENIDYFAKRRQKELSENYFAPLVSRSKEKKSYGTPGGLNSSWRISSWETEVHPKTRKVTSLNVTVSRMKPRKDTTGDAILILDGLESILCDFQTPKSCSKKKRSSRRSKKSWFSSAGSL
jgi:hypothetical protein